MFWLLESLKFWWMRYQYHLCFLSVVSGPKIAAKLHNFIKYKTIFSKRMLLFWYNYEKLKLPGFCGDFASASKITNRVKYKGSPIPFLITESRKIIWSFHASREIQNQISRSRKSQNSNSRGGKLEK